MTQIRLTLGLALSLLSFSGARAQVTIDVAKITCEQLVLYEVAPADYIAVWLHGYYSAKRNSTLVDTQAFKANADKVRGYCRYNPNVPVMQAVENVLGPGK